MSDNNNSEENIRKLLSSRSNTTSPINFNAKSESSSGYSSSPPTPTSPFSISPPHTLKRSKSTSFRLINRSLSNASNSSQISLYPEQEDRDILATLIGWYPALLLRVFIDLTLNFLYIFLRRLPFVIPTLWLSVSLWMFWKSVQLPLSIAKTIITVLFIPPSERNVKRRTVLISGGSTVQAIHLARNFYSAGARVVVCEVEGHFGLARFSTAVHKYYAIPEPCDEFVEKYIEALRKIVIKEKVTYFIPVSETSAAYYDGLAKPYLEELGCDCICPDVKEILIFDDLMELMRRIQGEGMATPQHYLLQSKNDVNRLYELGTFKDEPHFMINVGPTGCKKKHNIKLPPNRRKFKFRHLISEQYPWLAVQDYKGDRFVTCTTIKESQVVANVTCRMDNYGDGFVPVEHAEIELWLKQFFASFKFHRHIVGHMSFVFVVASSSGSIVPLGCQVGVRLPYICYTSVHPKILWKPCRHFSRSTSGPIVTHTGRYWIHDILLKTLRHPSVDAVCKLIGTIFGRREALFVFWDPVPYCAYYYLQLPINTIFSSFNRVNTKPLFANS